MSRALMVPQDTPVIRCLLVVNAYGQEADRTAPDGGDQWPGGTQFGEEARFSWYPHWHRRHRDGTTTSIMRPATMSQSRMTWLR